jgi:hypothetical protein
VHLVTLRVKALYKYHWRICQGMKNGLEDKLVATELAKKTKGWRKLPDGAVAIEERIYILRDKQLRQEIIWEHHNDRAWTPREIQDTGVDNKKLLVANDF